MTLFIQMILHRRLEFVYNFPFYNGIIKTLGQKIKKLYLTRSNFKFFQLICEYLTQSQIGLKLKFFKIFL